MSQSSPYGILTKKIDWSVRMLRHIISVSLASLAMTACVSLIPIKANAARLGSNKYVVKFNYSN